VKSLGLTQERKRELLMKHIPVHRLPDSQNWRAYQGTQELSLGEFFEVLNRHEDAARIQMQAKKAGGTRSAGIVLFAAGALLTVFTIASLDFSLLPPKEGTASGSGNLAPYLFAGFAVTGLVMIGVGSGRHHEESVTLEQARQYAAEYNRTLCRQISSQSSIE
jgi:hypothetical protein